MNRLQTLIACAGAGTVAVLAWPALHPSGAAGGPPMTVHGLAPAVFALLLTAWLARLVRSRGPAAPTPAALRRAAELAQKGYPPPSADVLALWRAGRKVPAVGLYRRQAGADLRDAKDILEGLAPEGLALGGPAGPGLVLQDTAAPPAARGSAAPSPEVAALWRAGERVTAVHVYRQQTGAGLADARKAVESLPLDGPP